MRHRVGERENWRKRVRERQRKKKSGKKRE